MKTPYVFIPVVFLLAMIVVGGQCNKLVPPEVSRSTTTRSDTNHIRIVATVDPHSYTITSAQLLYRPSEFGTSNPTIDSMGGLINPRSKDAVYDPAAQTLTVKFEDAELGSIEGRVLQYRWYIGYKLPQGNDLAETHSHQYNSWLQS